MKLKFRRVITGSCLALAMLIHPYVSVAKTTENEDPAKTEKKEVKKTSKVSASRNNSSVKIYPDIIKRVMHVVAKDDNDGKGIDFFVFDLEGTLIHHSKMHTGDHQKLTGLERGVYVFRVFSGDEETASGNIDIR